MWLLFSRYDGALTALTRVSDQNTTAASQRVARKTPEGEDQEDENLEQRRRQWLIEANQC